MINLDKIINYFNCKEAFTYFFIKCLNDCYMTLTVARLCSHLQFGGKTATFIHGRKYEDKVNPGS